MRDRYGVTNVVVDLGHGQVARRVYSAGRAVFSNERVEVIELN